MRATSLVNSLAAGMSRATLENIVFTIYRTLEITHIPAQAIENAKIHPDVIRFAGIKVFGLDPLRDSFGDAELSAVHSRIIHMVNKLV
jgi:hypothetical protein